MTISKRSREEDIIPIINSLIITEKFLVLIKYRNGTVDLITGDVKVAEGFKESVRSHDNIIYSHLIDTKSGMIIDSCWNE